MEYPIHPMYALNDRPPVGKAALTAAHGEVGVPQALGLQRAVGQKTE